MKKNEFIEFSKKYEQLRSDLSDAILSHVVVTISDERGIVWSCSDGEWKDNRFSKWEVKQDFEIDDVLEKVLPVFTELYENFLLENKK